MIVRTILLIGMISAAALSISGCGKNSEGEKLVQNVTVSAYQQETDVYLEIKALVNTGNMQLVGFELPIFDFHNPSMVYGKVAVRLPLSGTGTEIALAVNLTDVAGLQTVDSLLPNGTPLPVGGLGNVPVLAIPIGGGSKVYFALGRDVAMAGVAINIREFDGLGAGGELPINIFPQFKFANGVVGIAGIYTSPTPGKNGLALFVDAGNALDGLMNKSTSKLTALNGVELRGSSYRSTLRFNSVMPSVEDKASVNYKLYKLNKKRTRLNAIVR